MADFENCCKKNPKIGETLVESNLFCLKASEKVSCHNIPGNLHLFLSMKFAHVLSMEFALVFVDGIFTCFSL